MSDHEAPKRPPEVEPSSTQEPLPTQADPDLVNVTERGARPTEREIRLADSRKA
jgi:hypothetical protein